MKLNFTIELPCKDHENCYNLEVDGENNMMNYQLEGEPTIANGKTTFNLGNLTSLPKEYYQKITITEKFTRVIQKKAKNPEQVARLHEQEENEEFVDLVNKDYNELVYKHNNAVDQNNQLRQMISDLKYELKQTHPDPRETMEFKNLQQEFDSFKELQELKMKMMEDKLKEKNQSDDFDQTLRKQKFEDFERDVKEKTEEIENLKKQLREMEPRLQKEKDQNEELEKMLDQKYEHFEEMNKYINELLMEKKQNLATMEKKDRKIKELEFDIANMIRNGAYPEQKTGTNIPVSISEGMRQKYQDVNTYTTVNQKPTVITQDGNKKTKQTEIVTTTTTTKKTRKIKKKRKKPDGTYEYFFVEQPVDQVYENPYQNKEQEKASTPGKYYLVDEAIEDGDDREIQELKEALGDAKREIERLQRQNLQDDDDDNFNERMLKKNLKNAYEEIDELKDELQRERNKPKGKVTEYISSQQRRPGEELDSSYRKGDPEDIANLKRKLRDKEAENEDLRDELDRKKVDLSKRKGEPQEMSDLKDHLQKLEKENKNLKKELMKEKAGDVQKDDSQDIADLKKYLRHLERENNELKDQLNNQKVVLEKRQGDPQEMEDLKDIVEKLEKDKADLKRELSKEKVNLDKNEGDPQVVNDLKEYLRELEKENEELRESKGEQPKSRQFPKEKVDLNYRKGDPEELADLKEHLRKLERENEKLQNKLTEPSKEDNELKKQMKKDLAGAYKQIQDLRKQVAKAKNEKSKEDQEELDRALEKIRRQREDIGRLEELLAKKDNDVRKLQKELEKQPESIKQNTEVTKQKQKVIKLVQKDKIKEWQKCTEDAREVAKGLRQAIEDHQGNQIYDNLDVVVEQEKPTAYSAEIQNLNSKSKKYTKQIIMLLEEKKDAEREVERLRKQMKENQGLDIEFEALKEIFEKTQKSSLFFVEILKQAKREKFVNYKKIGIESEDTQLYLNGIEESFQQHNDLYKQIKDALDKANQELARLQKFEKDVKSGKNKDAAMDDFRNICAQNENLKIKLRQIEDLIDGEETEVQKREMPDTAEGLLQAIDTDFRKNNKSSQNIRRFIEDLQEELANLKKKLKDAQKNKVDLDVNDLNKLLTNAHKQNIKLQDILAKQDINQSTTFKEVMVESSDPKEIVEQIEQKNERAKDDILKLEALLQNKDDEINLLKDYERQIKSGQQADQGISDLNYVLNRNKMLYNNACAMYEKVYEKKPTVKTFEPKEETNEQYIQSIKGIINETNTMLDGFGEEWDKKGDELRKQEIYEKELKRANLDNISFLNDKAKKNLKNLHNLVEKYRDPEDKGELWQSQVLEDDSHEGVVKAIQDNLDKEVKYNRQLDDLLQKLQGENEQLKIFKKNVESGLNKDASLADYQKMFQNAKDLNEKAKDSLQKASGVKQNPLSVYTNQNDPDSLLEAIQKLDDDTQKTLDDLTDEMMSKDEKLEKLEKFKSDVENGKNKQGALKDLQALREDRKNNLNKLEQILEEVDGEKLPRKYQFKPTAQNPDEILEEMEKSNNYLNDYLGKLGNRTKDLKKRLEFTEDKAKMKDDEIEKITLELEKEKQKYLDLEVTLEKTKKESVSIEQLKELYEVIGSNSESLDLLIYDIQKIEAGQPEKIDMSQNTANLMFYAMKNTAISNHSKIESIDRLTQNMTASDSMGLLNICQKVDELKFNVLEMMDRNMDDFEGDESGVDISKATSEEEMKNCIYDNIRYLNNILENYEEYTNDRYSNLMRIKTKILEEKDKLKLQVDDLGDEVNKKTTLIGKLQVKIYLLLSVLEHKELMENKQQI